MSDRVPACDHLNLATNLTEVPMVTAIEIATFFVCSIACGRRDHFRQLITCVVEETLMRTQ